MGRRDCFCIMRGFILGSMYGFGFLRNLFLRPVWWIALILILLFTFNFTSLQAHCVEKLVEKSFELFNQYVVLWILHL